MKRILGLDLGTNSIGWALVEIDHNYKKVKIVGIGARILPMDAGEIKDFESGSKTKSNASQRTEYRGRRKLVQRFQLRRDRLHLVLNLLDALPKHYKLEINLNETLPIDKRKNNKGGQFRNNKEPKLAYKQKYKEKKAEFIFMNSYKEMLNDIDCEKVNIRKGSRIPYDWTLYYLRNKGLMSKEQLTLENKKPLTLEEFAWVLLSYNQKRGYEKTQALDDFDDLSKKLLEFGLTKTTLNNIDTTKIEIDSLALKVFECKKNENKPFYNIKLDNGYTYKEYSTEQITELDNDIDEIKIIERLSFLNDEGSEIDENKTIYKVEDTFNLTVKSITPKETKGKYIKEYTNGWFVDTNESNFRKFKQSNESIIEEVFVTRLYDFKGDLIKPAVKNESFHLKKVNNVFSEFKLLDPTEASNWKLLKKKTEKNALKFNRQKDFKDENGNIKKYISPKIYDVLKSDAKSPLGNRTKIIGGMFQVVDRSFYREELNQIIKTQKQFHSKLEDINLFNKCVDMLYPNNKGHSKSLQNTKAIESLLVDDILLYNRPLKSKKSEIANCKYEIRYWQTLKGEKGNPLEDVNEDTGEITVKKQPIYRKVVSTSHPYFQEYRIWDKIHSLRIIQLEKEDKETKKKQTNKDVTKNYIKNEEDYQKIFSKFNRQKSLSEAQFLKFCKEEFKLPYSKNDKNFIWNLNIDDDIKGNETRVTFNTRFQRSGFFNFENFLTQEKELELWHYLYSVSYKERTANNNKSLHTFFNNFFKDYQIDKQVKQKLIDEFVNYPKFPSKYCAYSEKALKKILPLIRLSQKNISDSWESEDWYKKWLKKLEIRKIEILLKLKELDFNKDTIDYDKVVITEVDLQKGELPFPRGLFNSFRDFKNIENFRKLDITKASYLIYGRHSELAFAKQWESPKQIREELHQELKQHSLNNPIAEKVLLEMMQVVADIWDYYGEGKEKFFKKIHVEVSRDLKKSAKEKKSISDSQTENRSQNKRIHQILSDFLQDKKYNALANNKDHFERLKIIENGAEHKKNIDKDFFENKNYTKKDIDDILSKEKITKTDFDKYKLWLEQGYCSPYSGQFILLSDLFDGNKYNIDHIFPRALITNNSLSNKVVVEVELNKLKSNKTARAFIQDQEGKPYFGIPVCTEEAYIKIVKSQFSGLKRKILLSKDIPKGFTNSQLNNSKYIARKAMELLSHIVREKGEVEFRSKHVLPVTGKVTSELKKAWQLNHVWTELVSPRFKRMNELTKSELFGKTKISKSGHEYFDCNLHELLREKDESFNIKRIDHRHHALDALIVALCTEEHVNYINNINADSQSSNFGKQKQIEKYRETLKKKIQWSRKNKENPKDKDWFFMKPGEIRKGNKNDSKRDTVLEMSYSYGNFFQSNNYKSVILKSLEESVPTFKQKKSNIRKATNKYMSYYDENGKKKDKKSSTKQVDLNSKKFISSNKPNIAIRKRMHDENPYGQGKVFFEWKHVLSNLKHRDLIVDESLKLKIEDALAVNDQDEKKTLVFLKKHPILDQNNNSIEEAVFKLEKPKEVNTTRISLTDINNEKKLKKIIDFNIQKDLLKHLQLYNTVSIPFLKAKDIIQKSLVFNEIENIFKNENQFKNIEELLQFIENNKFKFKNKNFSQVEFIVTDIKRDIDLINYEIKQNYKNAFSEDGVAFFNKRRKIPVKKVREYQSGSGRYNLGSKIGNNHKMVKGANSLFIIDRESEIPYNTIKLKEEINNYVNDKKLDLEDVKNKFSLKVGDLVYFPSNKEIENYSSFDFKKINKERIYKFVNSTGVTANFLPFRISNVIYDFNKNSKEEKSLMKSLEKFSGTGMKITSSKKGLKFIENEIGLTSRQNKNPNDIFLNQSIKHNCWKLKVDRLGNIISVIK